MGKDRTGQRTKGNQKPSSSGRSAELLGGATGFVGFSGLSDLGYVPAATQANIDDDSQISAEFRVSLRKMSKKDTTTKIKALQEFESLCSSEEIESIKTALPYWPRLYCKLSLDSERRVREATHSAHSTLVTQIGKQLAPYLRSLMPCWLLSMTDPHTPAAIAASKSFHTAFSEDKKPGVMIFCAKEIVDFIYDNLFIQTSQTLSDSKTTSKEDQENKYIRVLYCSLKGLCLFLEMTQKVAPKKAEIINKIKPLIDEEKFWKLEKHETSLVRSAWYDTIKSIFEYDVNVFKDHVSCLTKSVFSSLDCADSFVLPHIWIAFLHLCVGLPECWEHCGNPKSVFNRLFSVIRDGGRGSADEIGPQLLPILSVIPSNKMEDATQFYTEFFRSFSVSLRKERIASSRREASALIIALNECLRYMSKEHRENKQLWNVLIKFQVVELLVISFNECSQLKDTNLYQEIGKLLSYWAVVDEGSEMRLKHEEKLQLFWDLFLPFCYQWLKEENYENLDKLKYCLKIFRDPHNSLVAKRSRGVHFDTKNNKFNTEATPSSRGANNSASCPLATYISPLILECFEAFEKKNEEKAFNLFAFLLFSFSTDEIYSNLTKTKMDKNVSLAKKLFMEETILPIWEKGKFTMDTSVGVFMLIYLQLETDYQKHLLLNLKPTVKISALKLLIRKMTDRCESDTIAALWLKSSPLGCRLVKCLHQLFAITFAEGSLQSPTVQQEYRDLIDVVEFVFNNGHMEYTVFSLEYVGQMMKSLEITLIQQEGAEKNLTDGHKVQLMSLITNFVTNHIDSSVCWNVDGLINILKALYYRLFSQNYSHLNAINQVQECLLKALGYYIKMSLQNDLDLFKDSDDNILLFVLKESKNIILKSNCTFADVLALTKFVEKVLILLFKSAKDEDCGIILEHSTVEASLEIIFPSEMEWSDLEKTLCSLYASPAILSASFICREFPLPTLVKDPTVWDQSYAKVCLFVTELLLALSEPTTHLDEEKIHLDEDESSSSNFDENKSCNFDEDKSRSHFDEEENLDEGESLAQLDEDVHEIENLSLGQFSRLAVIVLHSACHSSSLLQMKVMLNNKEVPASIKMGIERLEKSVRKLISMLNLGNRKLLVKYLRDRCSFGSTMWCVTFLHAIRDWLNVTFNAHKLLTELDNSYLGYIETKQILLSVFPENYILSVLKEERNNLGSFSDDPFSALPSVCLITSAFERLTLSRNEEVDIQLVKDTVHLVFNIIVKWREEAPNIFLFASDLKGVPWEDVSLMVSIIRLLTVIVKNHSIHLLHSHWDVTLCALSAWTQSLLEASKNPEYDTVVAMFAMACCKCASVIAELMSKMRKNLDLRSEYPPTLLEEWNEFFAPSIFQTILLKLIKCNSIYQKERSIILYDLCLSLSSSMNTVDDATLKDISLPPLFNIEDAEHHLNLPENLQSFLNHLAPMLLSYHPPCQFAAFNLLENFLPTLMESWQKNQLDENDKDELPQKPLPFALTNIIKEAGIFVEAAVHDKEMGCSCEIVPYTDIHTYTSGYMLAWMLALSAINCSTEQNQQLYSSYIRDSEMHVTLLNILFKIMPQEHHIDKKSSSKSSNTMFNTNFTISPSDKISSAIISWLSCQLYARCLTQLPAAVRNWFTNLDRCSQPIVDKFTTNHVSPILIANEIRTINESHVKFDNMTIKCRPGAREIVAVYTIDEASMELVLKMAANHPLSTICLEDHKRIGVSVAQWRNWLFGLNTMLSHRNTPLLNSLVFWKKNVDQKFEGIEECFICYYVLHGTNHQIPKLLCRTCKKKFHSACLYKWFSTSNNSTCPICRSLF